jgi:hypothetical protein
MPIDIHFLYFAVCAAAEQQKRWTFPTLEKRNYTASFTVSPTQCTQSTDPCVPTAIPGKAKANRTSKGKNKRQIASLSTQPVLRGRPVYR